jgi:hypothetical protein
VDEYLLVLFVLRFDASAAAGEILQAAGLQTDDVEILLLMEAIFTAL